MINFWQYPPCLFVGLVALGNRGDEGFKEVRNGLYICRS